MTLISDFFPTGFPFISFLWALNTQIFGKSTNLRLGYYSSRSKKPWNPGKKSGSVSADNKVCTCIYFGSDEFNVHPHWLSATQVVFQRLLYPLSISPLYIALKTTLLETNFTVDPPNGFPPLSVPRLFGSREGFWKPFGDLSSSVRGKTFCNDAISLQPFQWFTPASISSLLTPAIYDRHPDQQNWSSASGWTEWRLDTSGVLTIAPPTDYLGTDSNGDFITSAISNMAPGQPGSTRKSLGLIGLSRLHLSSWFPSAFNSGSTYYISSHSLALNYPP